MSSTQTAINLLSLCTEDVSNKFVTDANRKLHLESYFYDFPLQENLPLSAFVDLTTAFFKLTTNIIWICALNGKLLSSVKLHLLKRNSYRRI